MKTTPFILVLVSCFLAAGFVQGQTPALKPPQAEPALDAPVATPGYAENIEVMRRLLKRTIQESLQASGVRIPLYVGSAGDLINISSADPAAVAADNSNTYLSHQYQVSQGIYSGSTQQNSASCDCGIEGSRLNGYGVIFDAQLPVHFIEKGKRDSVSTLKPLSQWDIIQKELHGEAVPADSKTNHVEPETIADRILKTLAENGHRLSKMWSLYSGERLTVIVTLRGQRCDLCHALQTTLGEGVTWRASGQLFGQVATPDPNNQAKIIGALAWLNAQQKNTTQSAGSAPRGEKEADDQLLLGDLHSKQGRYKEAVSAYRAALDKNRATAQGSPINREFSLVEIAGKLARAQNLAGDQKGAIETLARLRALIQSAERDAADPSEPANKPKGSARTSVEQLPSKLVITLTRENLDAFHAGTIDLERFKKAATVDMQMFLPKPEPPKPPPFNAPAEPKP